MDYKELLEILRKDLNFKKVDLYQEKSNKTRYREIELGEKSPTIEELISFTDTLGIRLSEFLYRGDITPLAASYYGKRKIEVSSLINNFPELEKQFPEIYKDRFKNLQCYTLFTLCLIISKSLNNSLYTFKNKDIRELKNFYKNREVILGADYAILSHLYMAVPEYSNELDFLTEKLFPINQSYGDIHDHAVQLCIKNAVTVFLEKKDFEKADYFLEQFDIVRKVPSFILDGTINIEMIYLKHLRNFLKNRNMEEYLKAVNIVNLFSQLGENDTYKELVKEVTEIARKENFEVPSSLNIIADTFEGVGYLKSDK